MEKNTIYSPQAVTKAMFVSLLFFFWALIVFYIFNVRPNSPATPIFYALMLINTFFYIRVFATITPKSKMQNFLDFLLGIGLAFSPIFFNSPTNFVLVNLFLFIIVIIKDISLISLIGFSKLLLKKIRTDTLGILLCALCLVGILTGFTTLSLKLFAFIFFLANIYILKLRPLYRIEHHFKKVI